MIFFIMIFFSQKNQAQLLLHTSFTHPSIFHYDVMACHGKQEISIFVEIKKKFSIF